MGNSDGTAKTSAQLSGYERWQRTIDTSLKDSRWHEYDCDIQRIVSLFNRHLAGGSYKPLDWRLIKAMLWTESGGPNRPAWKSKSTNP